MFNHGHSATLKVSSSGCLTNSGARGPRTPSGALEAAQSENIASARYLSRDELELGASALLKRLGDDPGMEKNHGLRFDRAVLDNAKTDLRSAGVLATDQDLLRVIGKLDEGYGRASKAEVSLAVSLMKQAAILERVERNPMPARPGVLASAPDATAAHGRRKLMDNFAHAGGPTQVAFFDADSTLRVSKSGSVSANNAADVHLLPAVAEKIKELVDEGALIAIVSNQSGVQFGHVSLDDADAALQLTADLVRAAGGDVHYVDFAERSGPDRKPNTGMFDRLNALLTTTFGSEAAIDKSASLMVGDSSYKPSDQRPDGTPGARFSNSDRFFAINNAIDFHEPGDFFAWREIGVSDFDNKDQRQKFLDDFRAGKRIHDGPLLARFER